MKITKTCNKLLEQSIDQYIHFCKLEARINADCPNLPPWVKDKPVEYYQGCKTSVQGTIETILHLHNAYKGYSEHIEKTVNGIEYRYNLYTSVTDLYPTK